MRNSRHRHHSSAASLAGLLAGLLIPATTLAQGAPAPSGASWDLPALAAGAARRFPQPVRVGDLADRQVLEPSNHQGVIGRVAGVVRTPGGDLQLVLRYGGVLGQFTREIAVPVEATTLLGPFVQVVGIDESVLRGLPTFDGTGTIALRPEEVVRIGLNKN